MEDITVKELAARLREKNNILLIDVREPYENEDFNIGGRNIPLGDLPSHLEEFELHKDDEVVVYCRSGGRSGMAKAMLQKAGLSKVRNLLGGMMEWQDQNL